MKITHISTNDTGGAGNATLRHCEAMISLGLSSNMLVSCKKTKKDFVFQVPRSSLKRFFHKLVTGGLYRIIKHIKRGKGVFDLSIWNENIANSQLINESDIIYIHWVNGFLGFRDIEKIIQKEKLVVFYLHDMWTITGGCHHSMGCSGYQTDCYDCPHLHIVKSLAKQQLESKIRHWSKKKNVIVAAPSKWLTECAKKSAIFKNIPVYTIPNVVNINIFKPLDKKIVREKLRLENNKKYIIFSSMGVDNPYKGFSFLMDTFRLLNNEQIEFIMVGPAIPQYIPDPIKDKLHLTGYINSTEKMVEWYNAADIHISTSLADNFPNVIIESMACGIPSVAFATGGIVDQIKHRENGYLVPQKNIKEMINGIKWILYEADYFALSQNARTYVTNHYSYNEILRIHHNVLLYKKYHE